MITITISRNPAGRIYAFSVFNHSKNDVCAAVSLLTLNTVNGIEALTDEPFTYDYNPEGGFLKVELPLIKEGHGSPEVGLLLDVMALGLHSVKESYRNEIEIKDDVSHD